MDQETARAFVAGPGEYPARLRAYLEQYGDRCFEELKLESMTLRQDPALLVRLVASGGSMGDAAQTIPHKPPRDPVLRLLVGRARQAIAGRESSRLDRARVYGMARDIVRRAGDLGATQGRLDHPADVFWLTLDEAFTDTGDVRAAIARRRSDQEAYARLPHYRRVVFAREPFDRRSSTAVTVSADDMEATGLLTGVAVSAGTVTGTVRIVTDASAVRPRPGDILVTAMTDPGWVFLLAGAGGVIAERGSPLSHTAIVARELGVPMVVGVDRATRRFRDGDVVEIDGAAGTVRVLTSEGVR
jgi:pyruvate,water dikinase